MVSSYRISECYNAQCLLWDVAGAVVWSVRLLVRGVRLMVTALVAVLLALWATRFAVVTVAKALALAGGLAVVVAAVAMIPLTFWLGLGITAALAYVGYPRGK